MTSLTPAGTLPLPPLHSTTPTASPIPTLPPNTQGQEAGYHTTGSWCSPTPLPSPPPPPGRWPCRLGMGGRGLFWAGPPTRHRLPRAAVTAPGYLSGASCDAARLALAGRDNAWTVGARLSAARAGALPPQDVVALPPVPVRTRTPPPTTAGLWTWDNTLTFPLHATNPGLHTSTSP